MTINGLYLRGKGNEQHDRKKQSAISNGLA